MKPIVVRQSVTLAAILSGLLLHACSGDSIIPEVASKKMKPAFVPKKQPSSRMLPSIGVVTGPDFRMCPSPCCGGWIIKIDREFYTFSNFPENTGIDPQRETFPLRVYVLWSRDTTLACNHILVRWIRPEDSEFTTTVPIPIVASPQATVPNIKQ